MSTVPSGDLVAQGSLPISDNDYPVQGFGLTISNSKTLTANGTTGTVPIFAITGTVQVLAIYGVVTTTLGANQTACYWRLNDGTATSNITLNTGTTISGAVAGSVIVKKDLASAALTFINASQERVSEPTTLETFYFSPFTVTQKTGAVATNIEFLYTTSDTPTSGVITFYVQYFPIGQGSKVQTV